MISLSILLNFFQVLHNHTLVYDIQYVPQEDSFRTTKKVKNYALLKFDNIDRIYIKIKPNDHHDTSVCVILGVWTDRAWHSCIIWTI